jgi:hypothetical protein
MHARAIDIPLPLSSAPGARPQESGGRLVNCYAEPLAAQTGSRATTGPAEQVWRRAPGLTAFTVDSGQTGFRGSCLVGSLLFVAWANKLATIDSSGNISLVTGTLGGTGKVYFARNNLSPSPQIACVTENGAFLVTASSIVPWPDTNLPVPASVCFQDGFFFFPIADRRCFASGINSTAVNSQTFITVESKAQATLLRAIPWNGLLLLCTTAGIEVWQDASNASPAFPYNRMTVLQRGLASASAIAGWEDNFGAGLCWVGDDDGVYILANLQPQKISPPDLDRLIRATTDKSTLEAFVYTHSGKPVWVLSSPTWTWEIDLNTLKWRERLSGTLAGVRWRATGASQYAFGKWIIGDKSSGKLLFVDDSVYTEDGAVQLFRIESGPVQNFPDRIRVARVDWNFVSGVGVAAGLDPIQTDPTVSLSWSDDGGVSWSNPVLRKLGRQQQAKTRVYVLNLGISGPQGRRWRVDISDPVYVGLLGGSQGATLRSY